MIFDIGGGNGFIAKALEDAGISTVLVEPGETGCINSKNRGVKNIVCASLDDNCFSPDSVQAIGMFDVIEHMEDDLKFIKKANKILQKNGYLFITVPTYNFLWSDADDNAGHYRRYTLSEMKKTLRRSGFRIEYSTYFFSVLPPLIFLFRTIRGKFRKNKKRETDTKTKPAHKTSNGITGKLLDMIWKTELKMISSDKQIPFGGSCLIIARKNIG